MLESISNTGPNTTEDPGCRIDPRIRRTRHLLQQALEKLLETKDFESISVQDITEAAGVPKGSFYNHFKSKQSLAARATHPDYQSYSTNEKWLNRNQLADGQTQRQRNRRAYT